MKVIENRMKIFAISAILILVGLVITFMNYSAGNGLFNYDIEFKGGTSYTFDIGQPFTNSDIEAIIKETTGQTGQVQKIGDENSTQVQIKLLELNQEQRDAFTTALYAKYGIDDTALLNMQVVSPTISSEMRNNAVLAILVSSIAMLIYVSFRFHNIPAGASAIIALIHDITLVTLFYSVLRIPLNYSFIAVILTILGYSINSTIVIFDRVRENKRLIASKPFEEQINISIKQTLTRSIYTTTTTLLTVVCLYIFGVQSIREFTLPIIFGIVVGTYSSVLLSGSIWYTLTNYTKKSK